MELMDPRELLLGSRAYAFDPDKHEVIELTRREFDELLEYSSTLPSGTAIGKRWKRNNNCLSLQLGMVDRTEAKMCGPAWYMGEYTKHPDPSKVGILWRVIVVKD